MILRLRLRVEGEVRVEVEVKGENIISEKVIVGEIMAYHDFTEMPVWQKANELTGEIYRLSDGLPKREDYALCSQIRNAAISVAANIAEGFGRAHTKEKIHFYYYSRGSCFEVRSHLLTGVTAGYFTTEEIQSPNEKCQKIIEELNRLIKGLRN